MRPLAIALTLSAIAIFAAPLSAAAQSGGQTFVVSSGAEVVVLPLDQVDTCEEAEEMQRRIKRSGYRVGSPDKLKDPRDLQLFRYEDAVATRFFALCPGQSGTTTRLKAFGSPRKDGEE